MTSEPEILAGLDAVVFDVVGTLVDETGTVQDETRRVFAAAELGEVDTDEFAADWSERFEGIRSEIVAGDRPWQADEENRRQTLEEALVAHDLRLDQEELTDLAFVGRRLRPWPDVGQALAAIAGQRMTCGLTNAGFRQIVEISYRGDLRWHTVLCTEMAQTFKPDPAAYALAIDRLDLDPAETLFVAAHGWDLRGAATAGFRTAYLPQPHAEGPDGDEAEIELDSLFELAALLNAGE